MCYEVWRRLPAEERIRLHLELNQKPTQFLTSGKKLLGVPLKTRRGLEMLVCTTGDLDAVAAYVKPLGVTRREMEPYDPTSRVERVKTLSDIYYRKVNRHVHSTSHGRL